MVLNISEYKWYFSTLRMISSGYILENRVVVDKHVFDEMFLPNHFSKRAGPPVQRASVWSLLEFGLPPGSPWGGGRGMNCDAGSRAEMLFRNHKPTGRRNWISVESESKWLKYGT